MSAACSSGPIDGVARLLGHAVPAERCPSPYCTVPEQVPVLLLLICDTLYLCSSCFDRAASTTLIQCRRMEQTAEARRRYLQLLVDVNWHVALGWAPVLHRH